MMNLPLEIINKIFTYISSNTANIIKESQFYGKTFPFFYLRQVEYDCIRKILNDYHQINIYINNNKDLSSYDRYHIRHIFTNDDSFINISEHTGINCIIFRNEEYSDDCSEFSDDDFNDDDNFSEYQEFLMFGY